MQNEEGLSPFVNTHSERVPPFALMKPTGEFDAFGRMKITRPDVDSEQGLWVNSEISIEPGKGGGAYLSLKSTVAYDMDDGIPLPGESRGSQSGSWYARKSQGGFKCIAGKDGIMNAVRVPGSSATCCGWGADTMSLINGNGGAIDTNGILPYPITPVSGLGLLAQEEFDFFNNPLPSTESVVKSTLIEIPPHTTVRIDGRIELQFFSLKSAVVISGTYGWLDPAYGSFSISAGIAQVDSDFNIVGGLTAGAVVVRGQWINLQGILVPIYDGLGVSGYTDSPPADEFYQTGDYIPNDPRAGGGILDDDGNIQVPGVWQGKARMGPVYFANDTDNPAYFCLALLPANLDNITGYIVDAIGVGAAFSNQINELTSLHWEKLCCATVAPPVVDTTSPPPPMMSPATESAIMPPTPPARPRIVSKTANYSVEEFVDGVKGNATTGAFTVTLPDAAHVSNGRKVSVKKTDASANVVNIAAMTGSALDSSRGGSGAASQKIDGSTSAVSITTQWMSLTFESDGTDWIII